MARLSLPATGVAALGAAGSAAMAASSWWVAATPIGWVRTFQVGGAALYYVGLAGLTGAWLLLGRGLPAVDVRTVRRFVAAGAAPLLAAAPFGRDLWAYAAQGHLLSRHLDPYTHGPAAAPGRWAVQVSSRWVDAPAPYGPVWLRLSQAADAASGGHPLIAVLLLRVPEAGGLALVCWAVPVLAARFAPAQAARGLWLGAASPLALVLGVGGGHNDMLMLGLALAGLALATRPGLPMLAAGAGLGAVGVLVKSPAAVVVAFTVPVWLACRAEPAAVPADVPAPSRQVGTAPSRQVDTGPSRQGGTGLATATAAVAAGLVLAGLTAAGGLGWGWTTQVNSDAQWVSWLSLPCAVTILGKALAGVHPVTGLDTALRAVRTGFAVAAGVVLVGLWARAVARPRRALALLTLALAVAAAFGPSVQPWYYLWALSLAGLVATGRRATVLLAAAGLVFPVMITPSGTGLQSDWRAVPVLVLALLVAWTGLRTGGNVRRQPVPVR